MAHRIALLAAFLGALPAFAGFDVDPEIRIFAEERYDEGDAFLRDELGGGQLMSKLTPHLGLKVADRTLTVSSFYAADMMLRHGSGRFTLDHRAGVEAKKLLSERLHLDGAIRFWRASDPSALPRMGVARSLAPVVYGRGDLSAIWVASRRITTRLGYRFEGARIYDGSGRPAGVLHAPFVEGWYSVSQRFAVGSEYRLQYFALGEESAYTNGVTGAVRYRLSRFWGITARGGPTHYRASSGESGWVPRVQLELGRENGRFDVGFVVGHDLVGASGFSHALWADYASGVFAWHATGSFQLFGAVSYFRNGRAPSQGWSLELGSTPYASSGYAAGVGAEWKVNRQLSLQLTLDRFAQVVGEDTDGADLSRNIAAVKLNYQAL